MNQHHPASLKGVRQRFELIISHNALKLSVMS
jgi:hypothetical protein